MALNESEVMSNIASFFKKDVGSINREDDLKSYVQDSFLLVELVMTLQEDLSVRLLQEDLKDVKTVGDLIQVFMSKSS